MAENRECLAGPESKIEIPAPALPYLPRSPKQRSTGIALIGCGGIAPYHLRAYKGAGYNVVALCNRTPDKAEALRSEFYPEARVYADYKDVLRSDDIEVVDIATPPDIRAVMIEEAIHAGKHILSQKPFVTDLDLGERLVDLADSKSVRLAVNQNGRWAPHFSYIREAIAHGYLGRTIAAHFAVHWDHNWIVDTAFNELRDLILYDFGVHWFDMTNCVMGNQRALRVFASTARSPGQTAKPPLFAQATIEFEEGQASIVLDGGAAVGAHDTTMVVGMDGSIRSEGPDLNYQRVVLYTRNGYGSPELEGEWFTNGFRGTMAELLCAVEEQREPNNSARHNLKSLALCFAAVASSHTGEPQVPGTVRRLLE